MKKKRTIKLENSEEVSAVCKMCYVDIDKLNSNAEFINLENIKARIKDIKYILEEEIEDGSRDN